MTDTLTKLTQTLDAKQGRYALLDKYYRGAQPLAYLAPEARDALGGRLDRMVSNIPRLAIGALAERLRVTGFQLDGEPAAGVDDVRSWHGGYRRGGDTSRGARFHLHVEDDVGHEVLVGYRLILGHTEQTLLSILLAKRNPHCGRRYAKDPGT